MSGDINFDWGRRERIGLDEAVLCAGKSPGQVGAILDAAAVRRQPLLLTRLTAAAHEALAAEHRAAIDYDPLSATGWFGTVPTTTAVASVAIVAAGTSDLPVAREAARTLAFYGEASTGIGDVGVAGLHRLLDHIDEIRRHPVVIAVAGMDAALVSVLGGLVAGSIIAVPTSTGYGAARGGETALHAALASCAPGIAVVNIDNGYGAACAALRILRNARHSPGR